MEFKKWKQGHKSFVPKAVVATLFLLFSTTSVFAQDQQQGTSTVLPVIPSLKANQKATTVATINIYNASVLSQRGNTLTLGFDISNREGV